MGSAPATSPRVPILPAAMFTAIITVLQLLTSLGMIFLILLHSGRGGGMSDMFGGGMGGGGSQAGSTTMERNLGRLTVAVAILFSGMTILLTLLLA